MILTSTIFLDGLVCAVLALLYNSLKKRKSFRFPLPPGPKSGILGHVSLPPSTQHPWKVYLDWSKTFGDVIYFAVIGNPVIVLNSRQAANELLDKRSAIYSSRPQRAMVTELMGFGWMFSSMPYGEKWRTHRRLFQRHFHPNAAVGYRPIQLKETSNLLLSLMNSPSNFAAHFRRENAAIAMMISHGHQIDPADDYFVNLADQALTSLSKAGLFGSFMVDYIPLLKYVPQWVPGAAFQKQASAWRKITRAMIDEPFETVKRTMEDNASIKCPSLASSELDALSADGEHFYDEETVKNVSGIIYAAGAETSTTVLLVFLLAMTLNPDMQFRAQEEIDSVVGSSRLPSFEDYDSLPYVRALVYESLRWSPVTPLGLAHKVTRDDVYRNMLIPKGTTVIPNVWAILHDEANYPEPEAFKPERFLESSPPNINAYPVEAFGFGRRLCPGRHVAEATVWLTIARILAVFNISMAVDDNGNVVKPKAEFSSGLLSRPLPFQCQIRPRTAAAKRMVEQLAD